MKKIIFFVTLLVLFQHLVVAQSIPPAAKTAASGFSKFVYGVRLGINISRITNGSAIGANSRLGLVGGIFADQSYGKSYGMRDEISYVSSGFKFNNSNNKGNVTLHYLYLTHLFTFNVGHIVQLHAGPQAGLLLSAVADTINHLNITNVGRFFSVSKETNPFSYGGCIGLEIYPYKGLLVGVRYNLGFSAINRKSSYSYNDNYSTNGSIYASNNNTYRLKNEMWQIVIGKRFGRGINK